MEGLRTAEEALQESAMAYPIKDLAPKLDKAPSTLYDELSLSPASKAKLSFRDAVRIMAHTKDHRAYHIVGAILGYSARKIEPEAMADELNTPQVAAMKAAMAFLDAYDRGEPYTDLLVRLRAMQATFESLFIRRRAECVSFSIRMGDESHAAKPKPRPWWKFGRRG